jgi:hypothetical protein
MHMPRTLLSFEPFRPFGCMRELLVHRDMHIAYATLEIPDDHEKDEVESCLTA